MLLDPSEEQLHLPPRPIQGGNGQGGQLPLIGQEDQRLAGVGILVTDPPEMGRIAFVGIEAFEHHGLVADDSTAALDRLGVEPPGSQVALGPDDKEAASLVEAPEPFEVEVPPVHDVEGAWFGEQQVEHVDIVQLAIGDVDEARDGPAEVEQRMQFGGRLGRAKRRPGKQGQAEVDGRGIQGIDGVGQLQAQVVLGIQRPGRPDEGLGELGIDPPVARFVRIGQGRATDRRAQTHMIELGGLGSEARLDIPQALAEGQLRNGHAAELVRTREPLDPMIAPIPAYDAMKRLPWRMIHDLGKEQFADVHEHLQRENRRKGARVGHRHSSRGQVEISQDLRPYWSLENEPLS